MNSCKLILVVDFGTSSVRGSFIDVGNGRMIRSSSVRYRWLHPRAGLTEIRPEDIWLASKQVVSKLVAGIDRGETILGITFSFFGDNLIPVDRDYNCLFNLIPAFDSRSEDEARIVRDSIDYKAFARITGGEIDAMNIGTKILWLKRNKPTVFKRTSYYFDLQQFIMTRLGFPPVNDYTMASRKMLFDIRRRKWSKRLFNIIGISPSTMAGETVESGTVIGSITGYGDVDLPGRLPIIVGGHDTALGITGLGAISLEQKVLGNIMGTFDCVGCLTSKPVIPCKKSSGIMTYCGPVESHYVTIGANPNAGALLEWFVREIYPECETGDNVFAKLFSQVDFTEESSLYAIPYFNSSRGTLYGLNLATDIYDIFRSVVNGLTYETKRLVEAFIELFGVDFGTIKCGGGGSRSPAWLQLKADITNRRVVKAANEEVSALGAAIVAADSLGVYDDFQEAVREMVFTEREYEMDVNEVKRHRKSYDKHKELMNIIADIA